MIAKSAVVPTRSALSASCPPQLLHTEVSGYGGTISAVTSGLSAYWSKAIVAGAWPTEIAADYLTWVAELGARPTPQWASRNRVVTSWPIARLRDFSGRDRSGVVPTLVLPPQAGHSSSIVDFAPGQSQMQTVRAAGLTRAASLDWIGATQATRDSGIDDYLAVIDSSIGELGGRVNLIGDCQGGWLAVIYAALHPERVHTLTIAGAPVDFHVGEALIHDWVSMLSPAGDLTFYRGMVAANDGILPGEILLRGFQALRPGNEVEKAMGLLAAIDDPDYVARHRRFETWFQHTQALPGAFYLWIVEHLFAGNELVRGTLQIGGEAVDLTRITAPLFLIAGETDHITPPAQVFALADFVGTPVADISRATSPGGHLGLFMGHEALAGTWPDVLRAVRELS